MSLPVRFLLVLLPLALGACGFDPMYGKPSPQLQAAALAGVSIDPITGGRMGQQFRADLEDKLNPDGKVPANPAYRLAASVTSSTSAIGVARDGTISRYNVSLDSSYTLYSRADDKKITSGNLRHVSSYNNLTNAYFSTHVAQGDAVKRGITELSELYRQRLSPYLNGQRPPQSDAVDPLPIPPMLQPDGRLFPPTPINQ